MCIQTSCAALQMEERGQACNEPLHYFWQNQFFLVLYAALHSMRGTFRSFQQLQYSFFGLPPYPPPVRPLPLTNKTVEMLGKPGEEGEGDEDGGWSHHNVKVYGPPSLRPWLTTTAQQRGKHRAWSQMRGTGEGGKGRDTTTANTHNVYGRTPLFGGKSGWSPGLF